MFSNSNSLRPSFCLRLLFVLALRLLFVALGFVSQRTFAYDAQNDPTAVASYGSGETAIEYDAFFTLAQAEGRCETIESRAFFAKPSEFQAAKKPLPALDSTGKVHGELPRPRDLRNYSREDLLQLRDELRQSVQKRIEVTTQLGRDKAHGQRQGAEQALIKSIEKLLEH